MAAALPPQALTLRVTERALIDATAPVTAELASLRASGIRLAIDSFGTGYASLSYLRKLVVDEITIDESYIAGLGGDSALALLTPAIVSLGRDLGIEMIAAGVDSGEQAELLATMGCQLGQGPWLGARLPASDVDPGSATVSAAWIKPVVHLNIASAQDEADDPACSTAS